MRCDRVRGEPARHGLGNWLVLEGRDVKCGVVKCGVVKCGVVKCGGVECGVVECGVVTGDFVRFDLARRGLAMDGVLVHWCARPGLTAGVLGSWGVSAASPAVTQF